MPNYGLEVQTTLDQLNSPGNIQGRGGTTWGFDESRGAYFTQDPSGKIAYQNTSMPSSTTMTPTEKGGGLIHDKAKWSQDEGKWVSPFSYDKLMMYVTAGLLSVGAANAIMAGGAAGEAAVTAPGLSTGAVTPSMTTAAAALGGAPVSGATGGGSIISGLLSHAPDISKVIGAFTSGQKANRGLEGEMQNAYDRNMIDAEKQRNATEQDALRKMNQTSYIMNNTHDYVPPTITVGGQQRTAPIFGYEGKASTPEQIDAAKNLQGQLVSRMKPGGTYTPAPATYAKPGTLETVGNYAGPILSLMGAFKKK